MSRRRGGPRCCLGVSAQANCRQLKCDVFRVSLVQVLARSSPEDKLTLVSMLKKEGEVVAVTGRTCPTSTHSIPTARGPCSPLSVQASTAHPSISLCWRPR